MNNGVMWGWIGGLAGGIIGTYFSIRNTNGPRERAFVVKLATVCLIAVLVFVGLVLSLPTPYRYFMWIPYSILLPLGIIFWNRKQQAIRQQESQNKGLRGTR
jgi:hypothetical protein